jgi:hypothetical protein
MEKLPYKIKEKKTAYNKRFGARWGVRPQKVLSDFQAFAPARTFVKPRPPQSRHPLQASRAKAR